MGRTERTKKTEKTERTKKTKKTERTEKTGEWGNALKKGMKTIYKKAELKLVSSMLIFGTIGIFVRYLPFSSAFIALVRGMIGTLFLWFVLCFSGKKPDWQAIRRNLLLLILSGGAIGVNWILLFEAYRYTTVSTATLCYYMAPVIVIVLSPVLLKERITRKKLICVLASLAGMILISGIFHETGQENSVRGVICGLGAAVFYAAVVLINKFLRNISGIEATMMQLFFGSILLLPYVLITEDVSALSFSVLGVMLLMIVGVVHTGVGYWLYFSSLQEVKAQTAAIFSYLDPAAAILLSAVFLKEHLGIWGAAGTVLILGSAPVSEVRFFNIKD